MKEQTAAYLDKARELLGQFDLELDLRRQMADATPVKRTVVAIAAALRNKLFLLMSSPSK